jgi:ATP-dependent RNA helicase RhlE
VWYALIFRSFPALTRLDPVTLLSPGSIIIGFSSLQKAKFMSFSALGLATELLSAVADQGYQSPTPIQSQAIPVILAEHDLLAGAQTGTGKTAAFTLPLLQRLMQQPEGTSRRVRALLVAPTRELAQQVADSIRTYGKYLPLRSAVVYGGMNITPQIKQLQKGVDVLIATPGRLLDLVDRKAVDLSQVEMVVLDEADRMLDMGFLPAINRIFSLVPKTRQTLLFSATFSPEIRKLSGRYLNAPQYVQTAQPNSASEDVEQSLYWVDGQRKQELLSHLIDSGDWQQILVFTRTRRGADRLAKQLGQNGIRATAIHGNKTQNARTRALRDFKARKVTALVATDVAARGLDIDRLSHVINYEIPDNPEDYLHRIGRTGRGGNQGTAISLVAAEEKHRISAIQRLLKRKIPVQVMEGFEPQQQVSDRPRTRHDNQRPGRRADIKFKWHSTERGDRRKRRQGKPRRHNPTQESI